MKKQKIKEKLSKRKDTCLTYADKIHKTNPTLLQVEGVLNHVWEVAYAEGYQDANYDLKKLRNCREKLLLRDFDQLRDIIEDKIHQQKS
jgi:hypothetical protein